MSFNTLMAYFLRTVLLAGLITTGVGLFNGEIVLVFGGLFIAVAAYMLPTGGEEE